MLDCVTNHLIKLLVMLLNYQVLSAFAQRLLSHTLTILIASSGIRVLEHILFSMLVLVTHPIMSSSKSSSFILFFIRYEKILASFPHVVTFDQLTFFFSLHLIILFSFSSFSSFPIFSSNFPCHTVTFLYPSLLSFFIYPQIHIIPFFL